MRKQHFLFLLSLPMWSTERKTGATPDGRGAGVPFAPGANPHGRDTHGVIASLNSVAKLSYKESRDGISNTFSILPKALGADIEEQKENLVTLMEDTFLRMRTISM